MSWEIRQGDAMERLREMPDESVHCCVTSPPYWGLRDYGVSGQLGLERTPELYIERMVAVFREVKRVLRADGTLWCNMGDSYYRDPAKGDRAEYLGLHKNIADSGCHRASQARSIPNGMKPKDLVGIPWLLAFALRADGWWLRCDVIWEKRNCMPESVQDRPTRSHEYIFLLAKSARYYFDAEAIKERQTDSTLERAQYGWNGRTNDGSDGARTGSTFKRTAESGEPIGTIPEDGFRNKRSVWDVPTNGFSEAHFATFPPKLIEPCILAGCPENGTVLDPFSGAGTSGLVATRLGRNYIGIELNPEYVEMSRRRIVNDAPLLNQPRSSENEGTLATLLEPNLEAQGRLEKANE